VSFGRHERVRRSHDNAMVSTTTIGWEATDWATGVSGPAGRQVSDARSRCFADAVAMIDLRATGPSDIANAIVVAVGKVRRGRQRTGRHAVRLDGDPTGVGMRGHPATQGITRSWSPFAACARSVDDRCAGGRLGRGGVDRNSAGRSGQDLNLRPSCYASDDTGIVRFPQNTLCSYSMAYNLINVEPPSASWEMLFVDTHRPACFCIGNGTLLYHLTDSICQRR
jgi:hypothetical protein